MVIDLRKYAPNDLLSKIALVSLNTSEQGGIKLVRLIRTSHKTITNQVNVIGLGNIAHTVDGDQGNLVGLGNIAHTVDGDQINVIGLGINYAHTVDGTQGNGFGLGNIAHTVNRDQGNVIGLGNIAHTVDGTQGNLVGLGNIAHTVNRDQGNFVGGINYAHTVDGDQSGALICWQRKNPTAEQSKCLLRYNPLENVGLGSSAIHKINKAREYFDKLEQEADSPRTYGQILTGFVREKDTLRKTITGHWTYRDILSREARKRLKVLERSRR